MFKLNHQRFLKIKIKSLSAESRIIRDEEGKCYNKYLRASLHYHRTEDVRRETRAALLAYGYLRGKKLIEIEAKNSIRDSRADYRAGQIVKKFGNLSANETFKAWIS